MARQGYPTGVMVHSDQGSQYCSRDFRALLLTNNCIQSMLRRGNCWDNAVTGSFFHTGSLSFVMGWQIRVMTFKEKILLSFYTKWVEKLRH